MANDLRETKTGVIKLNFRFGTDGVGQSTKSF